MSYIFGSFNLLKLNYESRGEKKKDFKMIAKIIKQEKFDVVALQEVVSEMAVYRSLLPALGSNWDAVWRQPKSVSKGAPEGYAYVWRKNRLKLVESDSNPKIIERYRGNDYVEGGKLIRPPMVARFTPQDLPGGTNVEFRLINTHIAYSKAVGVENSGSDLENRKREYELIAKEIYRLESTKAYGNNLPPYTILMGDYNLCLTNSSTELKERFRIAEKREVLNVQRELTSLKKPTEGKEMESYYSNDYDHFTFDSGYKEKMRIVESRVDALGKYYDNDTVKYQNEVSDHVPIKLIVDLKMR